MLGVVYKAAEKEVSFPRELQYLCSFIYSRGIFGPPQSAECSVLNKTQAPCSWGTHSGVEETRGK